MNSSAWSFEICCRLHRDFVRDVLCPAFHCRCLRLAALTNRSQPKNWTGFYQRSSFIAHDGRYAPPATLTAHDCRSNLHNAHGRHLCCLNRRPKCFCQERFHLASEEKPNIHPPSKWWAVYFCASNHGDGKPRASFHGSIVMSPHRLPCTLFPLNLLISRRATASISAYMPSPAKSPNYPKWNFIN